MFKSRLILLVLAFCLLASYTTSAQRTSVYEEDYQEEEEEQQSYVPTNYDEEEEEEQYYEEEEEEEQYYEEEEEEEEYYEEEEEEEEYYEEEEEEEEQQYYAPYVYEEEENEEYEEYEEEEYNYTEESYAGNDSYSYGGNSSYGYGSNQGYTGGYNSNSGSPSSSPAFPTSLLTGFVVDIHFLAVDTHFQYIAYHYCSDLFPGFTQCAIYNGTGSNSRLVATEQVVSAEIFKTLPLAERKLYHSHAYAVKNGLLVLPGVSAENELAAYASVINTYGKVVDYWHSFQDFPLGAPRLAYGLTDDSQLNTTIIREMDRALNLGTTWQQRRDQRASLKVPEKIEGADDWLESGKYPQYVIKEFDVPSNSSQ